MSQAAHHGHHITPKKTLIMVFGGLVLLTILTVITSRIDLGALNVPLALVIALCKATLVVLFFMALKYDNRVNMLVLAVGVLFVIVFLVFTLFDTAYRGDLGNVSAQTIGEMERSQAALVAPEAGGPAPDTHVAGEAPAAEEEAHDDGEEAHGDEEEALDGAALLQTYLCTTCHVVDGPDRLVGPSLYDVGTRLTADEIRESIMEPDAVIAESFVAGVMSATMNAQQFYDKVTPEELDAMVEYLSSRKE